jgi:hypothetical protein
MKEELDSSDLGYGPVAGSREHGNETVASTEMLANSLKNYSCIKLHSAPCS